MKTQINNRHRHLSEAARRYAQVLYELKIPADAVKESERIFSETPELGEALCSPVVSQEKKFSLIDRIFPAEIRNFLRQPAGITGWISQRIFSVHMKNTAGNRNIL